jgi:hypothetical protein
VFKDYPSRRVQQRGILCPPKRSCRKNYPAIPNWEPNLFSDDVKSMNREKTPVLTPAVSHGSRENNDIPTKRDMISDMPNTGDETPTRFTPALW